jgi:hypothetical protein
LVTFADGQKHTFSGRIRGIGGIGGIGGTIQKTNGTAARPAFMPLYYKT